MVSSLIGILWFAKFVILHVLLVMVQQKITALNVLWAKCWKEEIVLNVKTKRDIELTNRSSIAKKSVEMDCINSQKILPNVMITIHSQVMDAIQIAMSNTVLFVS